MSGAVVPANQSSGFFQQGSVDWVALSNTTVGFSVAVLSRFSKAGIDLLTLQMGRAICSNFVLEPKAQEQISEAIRCLRRYGSYGDVIWFGFGIKEIVRDLADTEEGLALVALCAALSTAYDSYFISRVLRELCILSKAPGNLTPALHQWRALAEVCAGILMSSHFAKLANGLHCLMMGMIKQSIGKCNEPTTPVALAEAIQVVARISKHNLSSATFSGSLDCAWLAAFSESILSLDVGVCDSEGTLFYRSRSSNDGHPQVTIILGGVKDRPSQKGLLTAKFTILPSGDPLIYHVGSEQQAPSMLNCEGSWSTILHDVFRDHLDVLLSGPAGQHFASYLNCVSCLSRDFSRHNSGDERVKLANDILSSHPVNPLLWTYDSIRGHNFSKAASRLLPELFQCLSTHPPVVHEGANLQDVLRPGTLALESLVALCPCGLHSKKAIDSGVTTPCLQTISETIIVFLWILVDSDIDNDVAPSIAGLTKLFIWVRDSGFDSGHSYSPFPQLNAPHSQFNSPRSLPDYYPFFAHPFKRNYPYLGIDLVFQVLSGSTGLAINKTMPKTLARVGNGICVYQHAVQDPTLPIETMFRFRVVRGYISYSGCRYKELCGIKQEHMQNRTESVASSKSKEFINNFTAPVSQSISTFVEETDDQTRLEMAYILSSTVDGHHQKTYLHLPEIFQTLQNIVTPSRHCKCPHDLKCSKLVTVRVPNVFASESRLYLTSSLQQDSYTQVQGFLRNTRCTGKTWILTVEPEIDFVIFDQPLLLYSLISQYGGNCLMPFTRCLGCIIEQAEKNISSLTERSESNSYEVNAHVFSSNWHIPKLKNREHSFTTTIVTADKSEVSLKRTFLVQEWGELMYDLNNKMIDSDESQHLVCIFFSERLVKITSLIMIIVGLLSYQVEVRSLLQVSKKPSTHS